LARFLHLYDAVESTVDETDGHAKEQALRSFLVCAEARYVRYQLLLEAFVLKIKEARIGSDSETDVDDEDSDVVDLHGQSEYFVQHMPLPPWYKTGIQSLTIGTLRLFSIAIISPPVVCSWISNAPIILGIWHSNFRLSGFMG
jgi:hypothetical protein